MKNFILCTAVAVVALIGFCAPASARDMDDKEGCGHHHPMLCKSASLNETDAQHCHDVMKAVFEKDKASFKKMHELHEKLHAVLTATNFDKKAFLSLSSQMEQQHDQIMKRHVKAFADVAGKLTPEEREEIVRQFHEHMMGGMMPHHDGFHGFSLHGADRKDSFSNLNK